MARHSSRGASASPPASATESLAVIAVGCAVTVPAIAGCTVFSYGVFRGNATELKDA